MNIEHQLPFAFTSEVTQINLDVKQPLVLTFNIFTYRHKGPVM